MLLSILHMHDQDIFLCRLFFFTSIRREDPYNDIPAVEICARHMFIPRRHGLWEEPLVEKRGKTSGGCIRGVKPGSLATVLSPSTD